MHVWAACRVVPSDEVPKFLSPARPGKAAALLCKEGANTHVCMSGTRHALHAGALDAPRYLFASVQ